MCRIVIIAYIFIAVPSFANSCLSYFQRQSITSVQALTLLEQNLKTDLKYQGRPSEDPFLILGQQTRLRFYTVATPRLIGQGRSETRLKLEELEDLGIKTKAEIDVMLSILGESSFRMTELGPNSIRVRRWFPVEDVPMDAKTGTFDANTEIGLSILYKIVDVIAKQSAFNYAALFIDLNHLKLINSSRRNHTAGDELIRETLATVRRNLRMEASRTNPDIGFKIGGDEFFFIIKVPPTSNLKQISDRLENAVRTNTQLESLFHEPRVDLENFLGRLSQLSSYAELQRHPAVLDYIRRTLMWGELSVQARENVTVNPAAFHAFIHAYLKSFEVSLRFIQYDAIKPGIAIGYKPISPRDSYKILYEYTDKQMNIKKVAQKNRDYQFLPVGTTILPNLYFLPEFSN